jgi:hypothetical protein
VHKTPPVSETITCGRSSSFFGCFGLFGFLA